MHVGVGCACAGRAYSTKLPACRGANKHNKTHRLAGSNCRLINQNGHLYVMYKGMGR